MNTRILEKWFYRLEISLSPKGIRLDGKRQVICRLNGEGVVGLVGVFVSMVDCGVAPLPWLAWLLGLFTGVLLGPQAAIVAAKSEKPNWGARTSEGA